MCEAGQRGKKRGWDNALLRDMRRATSVYTDLIKSDQVATLKRSTAQCIGVATSGADGGAGGTGASMGRQILDRLFGLVPTLYKCPPDATQRRIIKGMVGAAFDSLFDDAPEIERRRALRAYDIESTNCRFMVITPRRCGKTIAVSMFAAAYMLSRPNSVTCIFSVSKRASGMLMSNVKEMVESALGTLGGTVAISNAESLRVVVDGTERTLYAYPASLHTLRGVGGDLIILEEAAFIPPDVIQQIVTPLLEVKGTALCCISTPMDQSNIYSKMADMRDESGRLVFEVMRVQMACAMCAETLEDPTQCPHVDVLPPAWKDESRRAVSKALYEGNRELLLRETLGIISSAPGQVWPSVKIRGFVTAPRVELRESPRLIFTALDPSGGGGSKQACVSIALMDKNNCDISDAYLEQNSELRRRFASEAGSASSDCAVVGTSQSVLVVSLRAGSSVSSCFRRRSESCKCKRSPRRAPGRTTRRRPFAVRPGGAAARSACPGVRSNTRRLSPGRTRTSSGTPRGPVRWTRDSWRTLLRRPCRLRATPAAGCEPLVRRACRRCRRWVAPPAGSAP